MYNWHIPISTTKLKHILITIFQFNKQKLNIQIENEWINMALKNEIIEIEILFIYKKKYPTQENIDIKSSETKISRTKKN